MKKASGFFTCARGCRGECGQQFAHLPNVPNFPSAANKWAEGDEWLHSEVLRHLSIKDQYHDAIAAGLVLLRGNATAKYDVHRPPEVVLWAAALTPEQVKVLGEFVSVETDLLHAMLEDLSESLDYRNPGWVARVKDLCVRRDEVECILALFQPGGNTLSMGVAAGLEMLDEESDAFMAGMPRFVAIESDQLSRAKRLLIPGSWDGEHWWTRLVNP